MLRKARAKVLAGVKRRKDKARHIAAPFFAPSLISRKNLFDAGHVVVREGDPGDALYVIEAGTVEARHNERSLATLGPVPTLLEWDTQTPAFDMLQAEAAAARATLLSSTRQADLYAGVCAHFTCPPDLTTTRAP